MDAPDLHKLARIQLDANKERAMRPPISQYTPCPYQGTLYADNEWEAWKEQILWTLDSSRGLAQKCSKTLNFFDALCVIIYQVGTSFPSNQIIIFKVFPQWLMFHIMSSHGHNWL